MEYDSVTGQSYDHARWYGPNLGRFQSEDPASFISGDVNLFAYVDNVADDRNGFHRTLSIQVGPPSAPQTGTQTPVNMDPFTTPTNNAEWMKMVDYYNHQSTRYTQMMNLYTINSQYFQTSVTSMTLQVGIPFAISIQWARILDFLRQIWTLDPGYWIKYKKRLAVWNQWLTEEQRNLTGLRNYIDNKKPPDVKGPNPEQPPPSAPGSIFPNLPVQAPNGAHTVLPQGAVPADFLDEMKPPFIPPPKRPAVPARSRRDSRNSRDQGEQCVHVFVTWRCILKWFPRVRTAKPAGQSSSLDLV